VVQPPVVVSVYGLGQELLGPTLAESKEVTTRKLATLIKQCVRQEIPVRAVQQSGVVVKEILATAKRLKATYLVLGSHGHGAAYDLIAGSTTNGVLRRAPCPVLVVPSKRRG
ncbi:MAG: universal stress protein, partial [Candidatus Didemnitutus sp.]|nr:universal stress protein [Candidatus Didemnitutus sp.]